jgi:ABC-type multidrug transport system ATPase subunit
VSDVVAEIREAKRYYGSRLALQVPDLSIHERECIAFSGRNGAGKSTLLRVLCGATRLTSGRLETTATWRRSIIAYCPQAGGLYGDLTVAENMRSISRRAPRASSTALFDAFVTATNLRDLLDVKVGRLSGGFQKVAAIASALSIAAQILILDEPAADLDDVHRAAVADVLSRAKGRYLSLLVADHSPEILRAADRKVELSHDLD